MLLFLWARFTTKQRPFTILDATIEFYEYTSWHDWKVHMHVSTSYCREEDVVRSRERVERVYAFLRHT